MKKSNLNVQAKNLLTALQGLGVTLTHAQALEALARADGHRTLHVHNAKKAVPVEGAPLLKLARRMAARACFKSSGRWQGKETELLQLLREVFAKAEDQSSRQIESQVYALCEEGRAVEVKGVLEHLRHEEWPDAFDTLVADLAAELGQSVQVNAEELRNTTEYCGSIRDWRVADGSLDPNAADAKPYRLTLSRNKDQWFADLHQGEDNTPSFFFEVSDGVPVVRFFADGTGGECLLSVFLTNAGLLLVPQTTENYVKSGAPQEGTTLRALYDKVNSYEDSTGTRVPVSNPSCLHLTAD